MIASQTCNLVRGKAVAGRDSVTIKEIAKVAEVSCATVSMALRGHPRISTKRKTQIKEIAKQLDYRPNLLVRGLVGGDTCTIGMMTPGLDVEVHSARITSFEKSAREKEYLTIMAFSPNDPKLENKLIIRLLQRGVDGFVVYPAEHGEHKELRTQVDKNFPIVTFNGEGRLDFQTNDISLDYYQGGRLQVEHLSAIGKKRIVYICPVFSCYTIEQRILGAKEAAEEAGIDFELLRIDTGTSSQRVQTERAYLRIRDFFRKAASSFDAVACHNDLFALSAIHVLARLGVPVPDDVAVIGFDNISASEFSTFPVSTISQPSAEMGRTAFEMLEKLIKDKKSENPAKEFTRIKLKPELVVRASTIGETEGECI